MSDEELSYLDLGEDLDQVPDLRTVPAGEVELRLVALELSPTKKDPARQMLVATLEIVGEPDAKTVYHYMLIPKADDKPRDAQSRKRALKYFYQAFDIPRSGKAIFEEYVGNTAWATITDEDDPTYGKSNRVKRFTGVSE